MEIRYNNKNRKMNMKKHVCINVSNSYQIRTKNHSNCRSSDIFGIAMCDNKFAEMRIQQSIEKHQNPTWLAALYLYY